MQRKDLLMKLTGVWGWLGRRAGGVFPVTSAGLERSVTRLKRDPQSSKRDRSRPSGVLTAWTFLVSLIVLSLFVAPQRVLANDPPPPLGLTLAWNASSIPDLSGYRLYCGTSTRNYTNSVDSGPATTMTLTNLVAGITYYFAATVLDAEGLESEYSTEAVYSIPNLNTPPTLDPI